MKTLQDAASYSYCTKNEKGWAEVVIKFNPTIWDRLFFKGRGKELVFVRSPDSIMSSVKWLKKDTMEEVGYDEKALIEQVIRLSIHQHYGT